MSFVARTQRPAEGTSEGKGRRRAGVRPRDAPGDPAPSVPGQPEAVHTPSATPGPARSCLTGVLVLLPQRRPEDVFPLQSGTPVTRRRFRGSGTGAQCVRLAPPHPHWLGTQPGNSTARGTSKGWGLECAGEFFSWAGLPARGYSVQPRLRAWPSCVVRPHR